MPRRKKSEADNQKVVVPGSIRTTRLSAIARAHALALAAGRWADAAEYEDGWGASRCAWLAKRAALVAQKELKQARKNILLDEPTLEIVQNHVTCAQEQAEQAVLLAKQAPRTPLQPYVVDQLREAEHQAVFAWLSYSNNGQPEADLEIADLRAAYERTRQQHRIAAWLYRCLSQIETMTKAVPA